MGALVAALQIDADVLRDGRAVQRDAVVPADLPFFGRGRGGGGGVDDRAVAEERGVRVAGVTCGADEEVERQRCLAAGAGGGRGGMKVFENDVDASVLGDVGDFDDLAGGVEGVSPLLGVWFEDALLVQSVVDLVQQFGPDDRVVCASVCGDGCIAGAGGLVEEWCYPFIVEDLVDEWRVVAWSESSIAEDQGRVGVGKAAVKVVEDFCGTLTSAEDSDVVCFFSYFEQVADMAGVAGRVNYSGMVWQKGAWDMRASSYSDNQVASASSENLSVLATVLNRQQVVLLRVLPTFQRLDLSDFATILDDVFKRF